MSIKHKNYVRPKSYSEGNDIIRQFPKYNKLVINDVYDQIPEETPEKTNYFGNIGSIIYIKILGYLFHLILISVFEIIFFNYYIIQYENNALISLTNSLITPVTEKCQNLSNTSKIVLDDFIHLFVNQTIINNNALSDYYKRQDINNKLFLTSIVYCSGIIFVFFFLLNLNWIFKQKINYTMILLDNVIMIAILGLYEFIFFKNIVFNYILLSSNELIKNLLINLLQSC